MRALLLAAFVAACGGTTEALPEGELTQKEIAVIGSLRLVTELPPDPTNRLADDPRARELGHALFFDAELSPVGISCATCHVPEKHFTDGKPLGEGAGVGNRHTQGIVGSQWGQWFFWDGRADSLWSQALGPIENPVEMAGDRVHAVQYVLSRYGEAYEAAFGPPPPLEGLPPRARPAPENPELDEAWRALDPDLQHRVNTVFANIGKAIAAYERQLVPGEAPFDRYVDAVLAGDLEGGGHLTEQQVAGMRLFIGRGRCIDCHHGPMFTNHAFHNIGVPEKKGYDQGRTRGAMLVSASPFNCEGPWSDAEDCPEMRYLNPTFPDFIAAFKTPTLRYVLQTAPYMHHGSFATIAEVLEFYSKLENPPPAGHRELTLRPLHLKPDEMAALTAFLGALTGEPLPKHLLEPPGAVVAQNEGGEEPPEEPADAGEG